MPIRRTVFQQFVNLFPQGVIAKAVAVHGADEGVRRLSTAKLFDALLYAQITGLESLRSLTESYRRSIGPLCRSTVADALKRRSSGVFADIQRSIQMQAARRFPGRSLCRQVKDVVVLDASVIDLCRNLHPWAVFRKGTSAAKLHATYRLDSRLPEVCVITPGLRHDLPIARRHMKFAPGTTLVFDRGYWSAKYLEHLDKQGIAFVTRARKNNCFEVIETLPLATDCRVISDERVQQQNSRNYQNCRIPLRRVTYFDIETERELVFITNRFDLAATTIAALYKARWQVELFFKALKQNLKIRRFLGRSRNAIEAQIRVALIVYILVQIARLASTSPLSFTVATTTLRTLALQTMPLSWVLGRDAPIPKIEAEPRMNEGRK